LIQSGHGILGIAIAALGGAAVGVDRQRAYRENEPGAIGGLRTFALLGTVAGVCGFLISNALITLGVVILASTAAMVLIVRLGAGRIPRDATTEVAAMAGGVGPAGPGVCRYSLTCRNVLKWRPKLFPCRRPGKMAVSVSLARYREAIELVRTMRHSTCRPSSMDTTATTRCSRSPNSPSSLSSARWKTSSNSLEKLQRDHRNHRPSFTRMGILRRLLFEEFGPIESHFS
jgi:hypothetical protein